MVENIIIVGVDGTETAAHAAHTAAELAANTGARLHVISALESVEHVVVDSQGYRRRVTTVDDSEAHAAEIAAETRAIVTDVTSAHVTGKPADALVHVAQQLNARLIVVGNRRVQGIGRLLGSVATQVAQHAPCDVYIVKTT